MQTAKIDLEPPAAKSPPTGGNIHYRSSGTQWLVFIVTIALVCLPLLPILYQSILDKPIYHEDARFSTESFVQLVNDPGIGRVFANTLYFAIFGTLIAVVMGLATAILVTRTNLPLRRFLREVLMWPFYVSHLVVAFGWLLIFGPAGYATLAVQNVLGFVPWNLYSLTGMAIVAGMSLAPLTFLYCAPAAAQASSDLENAARIAGANPIKVLLMVTVPLMRPAIIGSTLLTFVIALETLSIPLMLGFPVEIDVWSTYLYRQLHGGVSPNYLILAAACVPMVLIVISLVFLQRRLLENSGRYVTITGKASAVTAFDLGKWRWILFTPIALYVGVGIFLVFGVVILRAFTALLSPLVPIWDMFSLMNFQTVFSYADYIRAIFNSLMIGIIGGIAASVLILLIAITSHRSDFAMRRSLDFISNLPRALPGVVAGIGVFYAALIFPLIGWLRNTLWLLGAAYVTRYMPVGLGAVTPALAQISPHLDQSGRVSGADWFLTSIRIITPLLKPALLSCYVILFIRFFNEYAIAAFIAAPGSEVIGSVMLERWDAGDDGVVAALATLQIVVTLTVVYIARFLLGVKLHA